MNPFRQQETKNDVVEFVDDPYGRRVLLDCQKCNSIVTEGRYNRKVKMLTWKCPKCNFISNQEIDLDE